MVEPITPKIPPINNRNAAAEQAPANPPAKAEVTHVKTDVPKVDVVELSNSTQARLLKQQGLSIPQIALQLKLDIQTVSDFFKST